MPAEIWGPPAPPQKKGEMSFRTQINFYLVEDLVTLWGWLVQLCDGSRGGGCWLLAWVPTTWDSNSYFFYPRNRAIDLGCLVYLNWGTAPAWSPHCSPVAVAPHLLLVAAERGRRRVGGGRPPAGRGRGVSSPSECGRRSRRGPGSPTCAPTPSQGEGLPRATAAAARLERGVDGGRTPGCLAPPRSLQSPPSWWGLPSLLGPLSGPPGHQGHRSSCPPLNPRGSPVESAHAEVNLVS